jgi:hypothetical protein
MTNKRSLRSLLHRATHRIPGVPAHVERAAGHRGTAVHSRARRRDVAPHPSLNHRWKHTPTRPPRFMPAWQRRIAAFFGREL